MTRTRFTLGSISIAAAAALTACSSPVTTPGGAAPPPRSAYAEAAPPGPAALADSSSASPAAPASTGARDDGRAAEESSRPGLGTEWGETQTSRVSSVAFEREDWSRPSDVVTLYYNDAEGIRAMTRGSSVSSFVGGGVRSPSGALSVRLLDDSGSGLPSFDVGSRTYVLGSHGSRYVIQIQNESGQRFEAVTTVDGLDVMDGRPGSFDHRGYLIGPWSTLEIEGFRQSLDEVAAFRFGAVDRSYAARKGDARNVGVIGVAFFAERGSRSRRLEDESELRRRADPFPGRFASPP